VIFYGIIFLLVFTPLAFGSVHVWAYTIMELGVFSLLALWFADRLIFSWSETLTWVKTPVNLILILFLVLIGLQILPLPAPVAALISPHTYADKKQLFTILAKAANAPSDGPSWMMLSYYFHSTLVKGLKLGAYCGMFFLVLNTVTSKQKIDILVYTIILIGLFQAVYAIFQVFSITPKVWWWKSRVGDHRWASGTFIVSNHFAGYMEMVLCLAFGFLIAQKKRTQRLLSGLGGTRAHLQKFVSWFAPESARPKMIFFFFTAMLIGLVLLLSASRGGILSLGVTMLLMSVLFFFKKRYRKYGALALCLCMATLAYGLHVGIDPTLKKFENPKNRDGRFHVTRTILPMVSDYRVMGVGFGNFRYVYPRYIDDYNRVSSSGHAHNDWVEAGTETGFPGLFLILLGFGIYIVRMIRIWYGRRDFHALGIGAGVVAGLLSIGMHSYFDFNMHIPANPLTLAALLAVGYAAVYRKGHGYSESFFYRKREIPLTRLRRFTILGLVLFASGFAVCWAGKHFLAEVACPTELNSTLNLNWDPELSDIERAIFFNSWNFKYHHKRGNHFTDLDTEDKQKQKAFHLEAQHSIEQALQRHPGKGMLWYDLGEIYSANTDDLFDYLKKWLPLADECFDVALHCEPKNKYILFQVARYWVWRSLLLPEKEEEDQKIRRVDVQGSGGRDNKDKSRSLFREEGIRKFQQYFQRYLALNPGRWNEAAQRTWDYFPDDGIVLGIVPENNEQLKRQVLTFLAKKESPEPVNSMRKTESPHHGSKFLAKTESSKRVTVAGDIELPKHGAPSLSKTESSGPVTVTRDTPTTRYHTVSSGETLYSISRRYGLTVKKVRRLNQLDPGDVIFRGQRLLVSKGS